MKTRNIRPIRLVSGSEPNLITTDGRPEEARRPLNWFSVLLRLLAVAWAAAVVVALLDEYGFGAHLPFVLATTFTGVLVVAGFALTHERTQSLDARQHDGDADGDSAISRDLLTGLPTLNHFSRRLGDEFARARRLGRPMSVVLVDVNNLTAVNKEYGVRAGDEVLRHVAKVIDTTRRFNDIAARLGDDEFGVLLMATGEEGVHAFIERLEQRLAVDSAAAEVNGRSISLWAGVCSGSAISSPATTTPEAVLEAAMASLNQAKQERERRRRMWLSA